MTESFGSLADRRIVGLSFPEVAKAADGLNGALP